MIKILSILSQEFILTITCYQFKTDKHRPNFFYAGLILELHLLLNSSRKNCHINGQATQISFLGENQKKKNVLIQLRGYPLCLAALMKWFKA